MSLTRAHLIDRQIRKLSAIHHRRWMAKQAKKKKEKKKEKGRRRKKNKQAGERERERENRE